MEKENANIVFSFLLKSAIIDWYFSILQHAVNAMKSFLPLQGRAKSLFIYKK